MANASDLPTEIWLLIAWYIPKSQLIQLKSLNSFFLNCWMDTTWRKVLIDTEFPHRAVRLLSRMVDPFVKTRTKRLTVCLRHFTSVELPSSSSSKLSLSKKLTSILSKPKPQPPAPTFQTALTHLLQSLPLLPHITTLKIELWHIPVALLPTLYQTITTSPIAKTIQNLRLSGHVDMFASLGEYSVTPQCETENAFGNLTEFNLELINRQLTHSSDISLNAPNSILSLAHFVLSLSPSLQLLRIWNWSTTLDLSPFFSYLSQPLPDSPSLVPLPNLKALCLILPFTSIQSSPQSLHQFLLTHSNTLLHLQLRLKMSRAQLDPRMEEPLGTWLTNLVDNLAHESDELENNLPRFFRNLQSLDVYPSSTPAGFSALLTMIKRTAPVLISLTIRDRYLTREEAKQVLDVLTEGSQRELRAGFRAQIQGQPPTEGSRKDEGKPSNLKNLRINITHLTVPFLDLLAHTLPQLRSLWLSASEIVRPDQFSPLYSRRYHDPEFKASDYLSTWKLKDLSIWQAGQKMDDLVRAVARAVPAAVLGSADYEPTDEE